LHLVHWNSTMYHNIDEAIGKKNGIAIIALFVQIEEFRRLRTHAKGAELLEGCDGILGDNFRPTQPLSDRIIRAAFQ
ncbi:hypothetical protein JD844_016173, partial [Phrynosoma platyrhinos]